MRYFVALIVVLCWSLPSQAMTYYFTRDLGLSGFQHLCEYSNGKTYSVNGTQMCPMSIEEDGIITNGSTPGFKAGEYQDGMTKVCVYNVMGSQRFLRINGMGLCPLSYNF